MIMTILIMVLRKELNNNDDNDNNEEDGHDIIKTMITIIYMVQFWKL